MVWERCHLCVTRSQDFLLSSGSHMRYTYARERPCQFSYRLLHASAA
jgi:hypothetical protein